jgi:hypothetical protein
MENLSCYCNDVDTVIAMSPHDASLVWSESCGESLEDYPGMDDEWKKIGDSESIKVYDGCIYDSTSESTTKTAMEWISERGRGFLCSTEC